jgi:AcrR family transcriptional regulator
MSSKKQEILQAARHLLISEGGPGFSMRKLARNLDMSLGNLQYHFPTRVDVLEGLLTADIEGYRQVFESLRRETRSGRDLLFQVLFRALSDAGHQDEIAVFRALYSFNEPEIIASLQRYYQELYTLLENGLAQLIAAPEAAPAEDSAQASAAVRRAASLLFPYLDGFETTRGYLPLNPQEIAEMLTDLVQGILAAPEAMQPQHGNS